MINRGDDTGAKPRRHGIITGAAGLLAIAIVAALVTVWLSNPRSESKGTSANITAPLPPEAPPRGAASDLASGQPAVSTPLPAFPSPPDVQTQQPQQAILPPRPVQTQPPKEGDQPAWIKFAGLSLANGDRPRVAIVIDDLGLDRARTARAIGLPAAVTLSFLAYAGDLPRQTAAARANGHELLVHVPMEPVSVRQDMGPNGLKTSQPRDEVLRRLRWDLDRFDSYVGINNHMGSRFTGDGEAMGWVLAELKARGLLFLDSRTIAATTGEKVAAAEGVPFVSRDVFLDDDQSAVVVRERLRDVEVLAKRHGSAVAIGHPHDATLDALVGWIGTLSQKGLVLVPLTDIAKLRARS